MTRKNSTIASLAYQERRAKRRVLASQANFSQEKEEKMNDNMRRFLVAGLVCLTVFCLAGCFLTGLGGYFYSRPAQQVAPTTALPTAAPAGCETVVNGEKLTMVEGQEHPMLPGWVCQDGIFVNSSADEDAPAAPTAAPEPVYTTPCGTWDTSAGATNWLVPGTTARGDIEVDGKKLYDIGGSGEGTSVRNLSDKPVKVFSEWGSGCEVTTDLTFLVNKDLSDGCGSVCAKVRIVDVTDKGLQDPVFYTEPIKP